MSSNPFRRSRVPVEPDPASANLFHDARAPAEVEAASTPPTKTKTKRVVIQSPPHSPEEAFGAQDGGRQAPPVNSRAAADVYDTGRDSERASEGVGRADASLHSMPVNGAGGYAKEGAMRAPYNPFARTMATQQAGTSVEAPAVDEREQKTKPALDVDAFKDILLRGAPVPAGLSAVPIWSQDKSGNSTQTSSLFDPVYGLQSESPTDAHHDYDSASDEDDNERSGLMGADRSDDLAPPAPPKAKVKGPQTVSFADFDQSIPPGFMAPGPRPAPVHAQHVTGILRSASPRPGGDLNKPLPPPPQDPPAAAPPSVPEKDTPPLQTEAPESSLAVGSKVVPPPPPTRKSGAAHSRARSSSNLSNMTQDSILPSAADAVAPVSSNKLAPPPPPTRKSHPAGQSAQSQPQLAEGTKNIPPRPPPLRRHPSKSGRGSSNVSRQPSDDSTTAPRPVSMVASSAAIPPPPPPRRAHGSKRTSLDGPPNLFPRRLSGEHYRGTSFDSERSASISSLQKVAEMSEGTEQAVASPGPDQSRDILAEMSAFQAELDALAHASKGT